MNTKKTPNRPRAERKLSEIGDVILGFTLRCALVPRTLFYATDCDKQHGLVKMYPDNTTKAISLEIALHKRAADVGISPEILASDIEKRVMIMKCSENPVTLIEAIKMPLSKTVQLNIIQTFKKLVNAGVWHQNLTADNIVIDGDDVMITDFASATRISPRKGGDAANILAVMCVRYACEIFNHAPIVAAFIVASDISDSLKIIYKQPRKFRLAKN